MKEKEIKESIAWFGHERPLYEAFSNKLYDLLFDILESEKINFHDIDTRAKTVESFENKIRAGIINNPKKMQDLVGARIIGYTYSDVKKIEKLIEKNFDLDPKKITDKSSQLGIDRVGYRSEHLVLTLSKKRTELPEFSKFKDLVFEVQIRTILQHAWAEIQHDKNYKFSGKLPQEIQRELNLLAGTLEIVDNEFERISQDLEKYSEEVADKAKRGKLDIEINTVSLRQYLFERFGDNPMLMPTFGQGENNTNAIEELGRMDISTLEDLAKIIPKDLPKTYTLFKIKNTFNGVLRDIMIIHDAKKYFNKAWKKNFTLGQKKDARVWKHHGVDLKFVSKYITVENPN